MSTLQRSAPFRVIYTRTYHSLSTIKRRRPKVLAPRSTILYLTCGEHAIPYYWASYKLEALKGSGTIPSRLRQTTNFTEKVDNSMTAAQTAPSISIMQKDRVHIINRIKQLVSSDT